ncbi:hypothetical protein PYCCODRAFT_1467850 [Trametes coccinea BRFM310]|uniref:F-box domain-containing protein n=1 Tax=Trametes coccinea (strain BRFM310) TaxID=1353009 RepID=A0A1Y2IRD1_TRAC3|nr:hypothetical protein PYCCODRAFT_1467850 [Trametes coccinea BRFM310]
MSALNDLPDELLDIILCEALSLPSSAFLTSSDPPAQGPRSQRTGILLVCKAWATLGQRHLYEGIILRRRRQAKALANTLLADRRRPRKARIALAERICRLRIEKVQCKAVVDVLRLATDVHDLYISLAVPQLARPVNWLAGFRCMSPRRLYLQDTGITYANNDRLLDAIEDALTSTAGKPACWNRLEEVHLRSMDFSIMPGLGTALSALRPLRVITAADVWYPKWWEAFIPLVANNGNLQAVLLDCDPGLLKPSTLHGRAREITHFKCFDLNTYETRRGGPCAVKINRNTAVRYE